MILRALVGLLAPIRLSGAVYLRKGVEHIRSDRPSLPNAFYDEFVGELIRIHEFRGLKGLALKSAVVDDLDREIIIIAAILDGERASWMSDDGFHMRLLRKHRLLA